MFCGDLIQEHHMMLYTRRFGMPVLDLLLMYLVKGKGFITFPKDIWNRYTDF